MTKTYSITAQASGATADGTQVFKVRVEILDEAGNIVLSGETFVVVGTAEEAQAYGETVFLTDLKRNLPNKLGDMALPTDPQPQPDPPPTEPEPGV